MRFSLGRLVATPGALAAFQTAGSSPAAFLRRHAAGEWGDLDEHDRTQNELAVIDGSRIFSRYLLSDGTVIWIITEADRSATTILLPEEY